MSKICKNCSAELPDEAKFCTMCGEKLEAATPVVEEPVVEESVVKEPAVEEPAVKEPAVEEPAAEETVAEEPAVEEPVVEEPVVEEPVVEETPAIPAVPVAPAAEKIEAPAEVAPKKEKAKRKAGPCAIIITFLLALFLVYNVFLSAFAVYGTGLVYTDIGEEISKQSAVMAFEDDNEILDVDEEIGDEFDGLSSQMNQAGNEIAFAITGVFTQIIEAVQDWAEGPVLNVDIYLVAVIIVLIIAMYYTLGKSRKAFVISGLIFVLMGLGYLVLGIIAAAAPGVFGGTVLGALLETEFNVLLAVIASAAVTVIGALLTFVGAIGDRK